MQLIREIFFTAVIIFVLFKLLRGKRKSGNNGNVFFTQNNFGQKNKPSDKTNINQNSSNTKKKDDDEGDYIDYEEIK